MTKNYRLILTASLFILLTNRSIGQLKNPDIPIPAKLTIEKSLAPGLARAAQDATLNFYAFWNSGKQVYIDNSVSAKFFDNTLPQGRPQGVKGLLFAQERIRKVMPDLKCVLQEVIICSDKVTARMKFTGTHKGEFMGKKGTGKKIEFIAIDILRIEGGKIVEDWHVEDNLIFFRQMGLAK